VDQPVAAGGQCECSCICICLVLISWVERGVRGLGDLHFMRQCLHFLQHVSTLSLFTCMNFLVG